MTASQRKSLRILASGYGDSGASGTKRALRGFTATSGSPDRDIDDNLSTLRQRSRSLYMSSPLATSAILTNRTNVVGLGLVPKPAIDADALGMDRDAAIAWQRHAEREFALWAEDRASCDSAGLNDFYELQQLALMSWLMSGDVFCLVEHVRGGGLRPYGLRLHLVEADRVATPTPGLPFGGATTTGRAPNGNLVHDGVEVDARGRVVAYHVRNGYPQEVGWRPAAEFTRVRASGSLTGLPNVIHVMGAERPEQYRGVPILAPVIEAVLQIRRYTEFELMAAMMQASFTGFVTSETDPTAMPLAPDDGGGDDSVADEEDEYEFGPGQFNHLLPGESITFSDATRPYAGFEPFVSAMAEQVGAALEIPADLLMKKFDSSYSASRAALMEAWKGFRTRRTWFANDFCRPVYELWLSEAVARGRVSAPGFLTDPIRRRAYLGCEWVGPSQGQLDPTKEISAEVMAIEQGLTTRRDAAVRLNGSSWDANVERLAYENERLAEADPRQVAPMRTGYLEGESDA